MNWTRRLPAQCLALIKRKENCRLEAYMDIAGNPTIGWGHKILPDENYHIITQEQADALLLRDVTGTSQLVQRLTEKVTLDDNQFSALVCFAYNVGAGAFSSSTLLKRVNAHDFVGAAAQFAVWNKATVNGQRKVVQALVERRAEEAALFRTPCTYVTTNQTSAAPESTSGTPPQSA